MILETLTFCIAITAGLYDCDWKLTIMDNYPKFIQKYYDQGGREKYEIPTNVNGIFTVVTERLQGFNVGNLKEITIYRPMLDRYDENYGYSILAHEYNHARCWTQYYITYDQARQGINCTGHFTTGGNTSK